MSADASGFTMKVSVDITTTDGEKFFSDDLRWDNLPYDKMHEIEGKLVGLLAELHALGAPK